MQVQAVTPPPHSLVRRRALEAISTARGAVERLIVPAGSDAADRQQALTEATRAVRLLSRRTNISYADSAAMTAALTAVLRAIEELHVARDATSYIDSGAGQSLELEALGSAKEQLMRATVVATNGL